MSEELAGLVDLELAWRRVKKDLRSRVFIRRPFSVELVELDLESWLEALSTELREDTYSPGSMFIADVPKDGFTIRPGSHLSLRDRVVYAACLGVCLPFIREFLEWAAEGVDFSYKLSSNNGDVDWVRDPFRGWTEFRRTSLARIEGGASFVVVADLAAYYENIDLRILISDLALTGAPKAALIQLERCLKKWAQTPGRSVPQGCTPSDILGKLYLDTVDHILRDVGYSHSRYVDDIRVFCNSLSDAKKAIAVLSELLRRRGLNLQSAKTRILTADEAHKEFEEVEALLNPIISEYVDQVVRETGFGDPYMSIVEADRILSEEATKNTPIEVIEEAYRQHFLADGRPFNATLFHFLLNRLGRQQDYFALEDSIRLLAPHPEETAAITKYWSAVEFTEAAMPHLVDFLRSENSVYDYQKYQLLDWVLSDVPTPGKDLIDFARPLAFDTGPPPYLRSVARALLGRFGGPADLDRLLNSYDKCPDERERVEIVCCLARAEKARRNAFLRRVVDESDMHRRAVQLVKQRATA